MSNHGRLPNVSSGMRRTITIIAALLALTSCASDENGSPSGNDEPTNEPSAVASTPTDEESPPDSAPVTLVEHWFVAGEGLGVSVRQAPVVEAIGAQTIESLLEGPSSFEEEAGMFTAIPDGTELLSLDIGEGTAHVDLSEEFAEGSGSAAEISRVAQIVYTLTQFDSVKAVLITIEGEQQDAFASHGLDISDPQTRRDYKDQVAPIVVYSPAPGDEVTSPISLEGTANVFEATVSYRLVTEDGDVLAQGFVTATCGTGCRGDYEDSIDFTVSVETEAFLEVFESSAEDGSPIHMQRVPITLLP